MVQKTHYDDIDGFCTKTEVPEIELELSSLLHNTEGVPRSPEVLIPLKKVWAE